MLNDISSIHNFNLLNKKEGLLKMYNRNSSVISTTHSDSRLAVADILSTMANSPTDNITPTTYSTLEGFSSGILTQTTPTLTPTTLRNIEQTFIELQRVPPSQIEHQNQAGFVPPVVHRPALATPAVQLQLSSTPPPSQSSRPNSHPHLPSHSYHNSNSSDKVIAPPVTTNASTTGDSWSSNSSGGGGHTTSKRKANGGRNMGGRKPSRTEKLSPEEEERRRVRRERNKMAAARCRKRRLDHTNLLVNETNVLEDKRSELQNEIQLLQTQKDELEFLLETHKVVCKIAKRHLHLHHQMNETEDIKPTLSELNQAIKTASSVSLSYSSSHSPNTSLNRQMDSNGWEKKTPTTFDNKSTIQRPNSLPLTSFVTPSLPSTINNFKASISEATGIAISTPSNGIFNFDALMEGGTGLTPIIGGSGLTPMIPTCSTQQRSSSSDLSSPDSITPSKLVSL